MVIGSDEGSQPAVVRVGSQVRIRDSMGVDTFRIVNVEVSDPGRRWISEDSPLARALLGHGAGDDVRVQGPYGGWEVTLLAVEGAEMVSES